MGEVASVEPDIAKRRWKTEWRFVAPSVLVVAFLIWGAGRLRWASPHPLWLLVLVVLGAAVVSYSVDLWQKGCARWQLHARIAAKTAVVASCIYLTGWGPMLVIGLFYPVADSMENFGEEAGLIAIFWALVSIAVGMILIALGWAPSLVHPPAVYGLAALASAGLVAAGLYMRIAVVRRTQAQKALEEEQSRFSALVRHSSDVIVVVDADGVVTYASPSAEIIDAGAGDGVGLQAGQTVTNAVHPKDLSSSLGVFATMLAEPGGTTSGEMRVRYFDGAWHWMEYIATNLIGVPGIDGIVVNGRDVTDRKELEFDLVRRATHDPLTGLSNRADLREILERAAAKLDRHPHSIAILYLDLDHFKEVNDEYGHDAGDQLLLTLVDRLRSCIRPTDTLARIGGDEFCVVLETHGEGGRDGTVARASAIASRMISACQQPVALSDGILAEVSASIGIVICEQDTPPEELLRLADMTMYRAKENGRSRYEVLV
ncbi:MAG: diguanylate cyclase domain-containing protein [Acidimicrobiales bacterium]